MHETYIAPRSEHNNLMKKFASDFTDNNDKLLVSECGRETEWKSERVKNDKIEF